MLFYWLLSTIDIFLGKISTQPHPTLCIQFLNRENNDKNNTFPLGKQICLTIVWGCAETLPFSFFSSPLWTKMYCYWLRRNFLLVSLRENSWKPSHGWLCCKISRFLVWLHLHWFWVMKNPAFSLIMASSLSSVLCVGLEQYSSSSSMWLVAVKSRYWVFGRGNILWWVFSDSVLLCFSTDDQSWPKKLIQFLQKLKNSKIILKNHI